MEDVDMDIKNRSTSDLNKIVNDYKKLMKNFEYNQNHLRNAIKSYYFDFVYENKISNSFIKNTKIIEKRILNKLKFNEEDIKFYFRYLIKISLSILFMFKYSIKLLVNKNIESDEFHKYYFKNNEYDIGFFNIENNINKVKLNISKISTIKKGYLI